MIRPTLRKAVTSGILLDSTMALASNVCPADPPVETAQQKAARLPWRKDGKLGLFLHWGMYSQEGGSYTKGRGKTITSG